MGPDNIPCGAQAYTGPTISGCAVSGTTLTLKFNTSLLAGGKVEVKRYNRSNTKALRALVSLATSGTAILVALIIRSKVFIHTNYNEGV